MGRNPACEAQAKTGGARSVLGEVLDRIVAWLEIDTSKDASAKKDWLMPFDTAPSSFRNKTPKTPR